MSTDKNDKEIWKLFEDNTLTHSAAHYLTTIHELLEQHGYARVTDIAKRLNITRGACSISLKPLKKRGLVVEDHNKFLQLSPRGKLLALRVEKNDELLEFFLENILGVDPDQAEIDACKIEHLLSIDTSLKLANLVEFVKSNHPAVAPFLCELRSGNDSCSRDIENCPVCSDICLKGGNATDD